ncbi:hypothetical protein [uncultured Duncaniella sp.]|uniref:hypothetical protein n=1 Tax=uncultured Duncaniella sp. TaxID=2768039 RepID=UPI002677419C|nr:hypothetical protein [uncultured Duncaniella sp.]
MDFVFPTPRKRANLALTGDLHVPSWWGFNYIAVSRLSGWWAFGGGISIAEDKHYEAVIRLTNRKESADPKIR